MYSDLSRPPLDEKGLRRSLTAAMDAPWSHLDVVAETGSTNADLMALIASSERPDSLDRTVLLTESQLRGRGRHGRDFGGAPQAQITMSAILRLPGVPVTALGWLPLLTGVAIVDALREVAEVEAELKWPNDVMINGRKVAGILAEAAATIPVPIIVLGVGINVTLTEDELPVPTATSLRLEDAKCTDRNTLVRATLRALATRLHRWQGLRGNSPELAQDYRERCGTLGLHVRAVLPGGNELTGVARDVDHEGRLLIAADSDGPSGGLTPVSAADVTHLRPTN